MDAQAATAELGNLMAMAQMRLKQAEHHHEKLVKKTRQQLEKNIEVEAQNISKAVTEYIHDIDQASADLQGVVNTALLDMVHEDALLKQEEEKAPLWGGPVLSAHARLNAQIESAQRDLKKTSRHRDLAVSNAAQSAKDTLELFADRKLRVKLGDLSPLLKEGTDVIDAVAAAATAVPVHNSTLAAMNITNQTARMDRLGENISAAVAVGHQAAAAAEKKLDKFLSQAANKVTKNVSSMQSVMEKAEAEELKKVRGDAK